MTNSLAWAQAYAAHGLPIFPCRADKTPLTPHGLKDATRDPTVIEDWLQRWPFADLAWALPATVVAVDIDVKPGRNGYQSFKLLEGRDPRDILTPSASTPSGGMHLLYAAPKPYRNRVAIEGTGIDLRAEGGYVVLPGHNNGRRWMNKLRMTPLAPAPAWLDSGLKESPSPSDFPSFSSSPSQSLKREQALATLAHACARIIGAPCGEQDITRHQQCFYIGGLIGRGDLDYATAFAALAAAARAMPVYRDPWCDLDRRVERSLKAGIERPLVL
jgi:putative DNA primase/helicase